ncbi:uncharacterized protein LOC112465025 [Temnothorax curvispinosus]|uniref:ribonuclease H n=1 Tax=Temnothorax curvispinosus TaxID=300111 RepID=A0A6J1R0K6_9HYME|nr:uncharacterized protein LOC112465025 [Temnothorax curvispinosus]
MKYGKNDLNFIKKLCDAHNLDNPLIVYTDGSRTEDSASTGVGVVFEEMDQAFYVSLPKKCSSFSAEAFAIATALKKLEKDQEQEERINNQILILSDCQSVLKAIKNNRLDVYKSSFILDIRKRHSRLKTKFGWKIIYGWIPAHRGYTGNEIADRLAKVGASEVAEINIPVPITDLRSIFREEAWNNTQDKLISESSYKGKDYFRNFHDRNKKQPWFKEIKAERYFYSFINRIRANHYNLNESLARKNYIDISRCDCGYEKEDINHVIWQCSRYDVEREVMNEELVIRNI